MAHLTEVTDATFDSEVLDSDVPVLVDFWAEWCGPCHVVAPEVEALSSDLAGRVKVVKLDVDHNPKTSDTYRVMSIPSLVLFSDGSEQVRLVGARPRQAIRSAIEPYLKAEPETKSA
ncbi:MAG: thioredoxin [Actinomycetota bacterium]